VRYFKSIEQVQEEVEKTQAELKKRALKGAENGIDVLDRVAITID
jgi:hypothetical protein